jgi:hypothetical protein
VFFLLVDNGKGCNEEQEILGKHSQYGNIVTNGAPYLSSAGGTANGANLERSNSFQSKEEVIGGASDVESKVMSVHNLLCTNNHKVKVKSTDWKNLCSGGFVKDAARILYNGADVEVVQIGAHVGFEVGDPIASGIVGLLEEVAGDSSSASMRRDLFHWTFVEPSPANFKRLMENLSKNSNVCDMHGINAAVVSDFTEDTNQMIFYSIRDTIDPETGYDSLSGKKLPFWITQVSSFSKLPILYNKRIFEERGLDVNDYIIETKIKSMRYTDLMREAMGKQSSARPLLVLIDTELFDCDIINGIDPSSAYLPKYLLFEHKCDHQETYRHLEAMGYSLYRSADNTVAILEKEKMIQ